MAIVDLVYTYGDGQGFILEIPSTTYTGSLTDINTEANSGTSAIVAEPKVSTVQVNKSQRKVR
jgi:hypothetical protein